LAGRLGTVDLHHPPARQAADAQGDVERQGSAGNHRHVPYRLLIAHADHRALAELLLDLAKRDAQRLLAILVHRSPSCAGAHCRGSRKWKKRARTCKAGAIAAGAAEGEKAVEAELVVVVRAYS